MTHTSTEQEHAEFEDLAIDDAEIMALEDCFAKCSYTGEYEYQTVRVAFRLWQAARRTPVVPVPQWWKLVPVEPTEKMISEGSCAQTLNHGHRYIGECAAKTAWSFMLAVAPTPLEGAVPVELPKPVGWFHRHPNECKDGELCNYQIALADKKDGWEEFPLYTEQQVRALLTEVPTPAAYADIKDAARYRWLRDNDWRNDEKMEPVIRLQLNAIWDEKIDAAIAAQAKLNVK